MTSSWGFSVFVALIFMKFYFSSATEVNTEGTGYITYDFRSKFIATRTNHITFSFKTFRPSGLLLYSSGSQGDFISIELIHGQLRFTINLGSSTISGEHSVLVGNNLADNKWHEVRVDRNERTLVVAVDEVRTQTTTPGSFVRLDLDSFLYVAGLDTSVSSNLHGAPTTPNFNGCLRNLFFDYTDILFCSKDDLIKCETHGFLRFYCPVSRYVPVNFPTPNTHLKLRKVSPKNFTVELNFRTYYGKGILVYKQTSNARLYLSLVSSRVELKIIVGTEKPVKISVGEDLNDGMWHYVMAGVTRKELRLKLDSKPELRHENPLLERIGDFRSRVYIGYGTHSDGFVGCMHQIKLNDELVNLKELFRSRINGAFIDLCKVTNKCFPNPCKNGGRCLQTWEDYTCDCEGTFYRGTQCKDPLYRATCHEYKVLGMVQDAYCKVDPDGTGPLGAFEVLCNMTASDAAKTIIHHNKEGKYSVTQGALDLEGYYFQRIEYGTDLASIRALIERSGSCRQYISYLCYNSKLLNSPVGPENVQWLSSTAVAQNYWGGARPGSGKCACGETNSCADPSKYCNCDADSNDRWGEDSGYLNDKSSLPVNMLQFNSDAKDSFFALGPLECFGTGARAPDEVSNANFISSACKLVNPPLTVSTETEPVETTTTLSTIPKLPMEKAVRTTTKSPGNNRNSLSSPKHHVTMTTTIATNKNSTLVTSVFTHEPKSTGVTVHSSITTGKSGVTVHTSITTKGKIVTLPPVTPTEEEPKKSRNVTVITRSSIDYITRLEGGVVYDARFIILITSSVLAFILLICVLIFVFLKRSGRRYVCCISCKSCRRNKNIPDIEVYRHSVRTDSPDVVQLDEVGHGTMEVGAYNMGNGTTVYHSVHRDSHVRKYVSFSASTSKL